MKWLKWDPYGVKKDEARRPTLEVYEGSFNRLSDKYSSSLREIQRFFIKAKGEGISICNPHEKAELQTWASQELAANPP